MKNSPFMLRVTSTRWLLVDVRDNSIVREYSYAEYENGQLDRDRLNNEAEDLAVPVAA